MNAPQDNRIAIVFRKTASVLSILTAANGLVAYIMFPTLINARLPEHNLFMSPAGAIMFTVLGIELTLLSVSPKSKVTKIFGWITALTAIIAPIIILGHYFCHYSFDLDRCCFPIRLRSAFEGDLTMRMSPYGGICFISMGLALLGSIFHNKFLRIVRPFLIFTVLVATLTTIDAYIYDPKLMTPLMLFAPMPLHSAVTMFLAEIALLLSDTEQGLVQKLSAASTEGMLLRRLLPVGILFPILAGFVLGQDNHFYATELGAAIMTVVMMVFFTITTAWSGKTISDLDLKRKQAEIELEALSLDLEKRVEELTAINRAFEAKSSEAALARDTALDASMQKAQFLANMSHEIRTPMNGVLGMVEVLLRSKLSPKAREYALLIRESGRSLLMVINDILDFSKIEAGKMTIEIMDFDPLRLVEDVAELYSAEAQRKGLVLLTFIDPRIPRVLQGDETRLRQVLGNLVSNAIKFTDQGKIMVRCMQEELTDSDHSRVRFIIEDTGIGLTDEAKKLLFQPILDEHASRQQTGAGLGLSISHRLVELMDGKIGWMNNATAGTTFWFSVNMAHSTRPLSTEQETPALTDKRVIIVDDDPSSQEILEAYLKSWHIECAVAPNAMAALGLMKNAEQERRPFDLAVVDMRMPGMSGLDLAKEVRSDDHLGKTKMILVTAYDDFDVGNSAIASGFSAYLTKPIKQSQLFDCIVSVTNKAEEADERESTQTLELERFDLAAYTARMGGRLTGETELPTLAGARGMALVVDDNPINRQVAKILLEDLGLIIDVAENGKDALECFQKRSYQIIFMDCQMPEMDGFDATRAIRRIETQTSRRVPIVAMTANAMEGSREECLAADMDDYVSKPVDPNKLKEVVEQWLPLDESGRKVLVASTTEEQEKVIASQPHDAPHAQPSASPQVSMAQPAPPPQAPSVQIPSPQAEEDKIIVDLASLRERFSPEDILQLFGMFESSAKGDLAKVKQAIDAQDSAKVAFVAHALKGACMSIEATELFNLFYSLEKAGKQDEKEQYMTLYHEIEAAFVRARAFMQEHLSS